MRLLLTIPDSSLHDCLDVVLAGSDCSYRKAEREPPESFEWMAPADTVRMIQMRWMHNAEPRKQMFDDALADQAGHNARIPPGSPRFRVQEAALRAVCMLAIHAQRVGA